MTVFPKEISPDTPKTGSVLVGDMSPGASPDEVIAHAQRYADMGMFSEQATIMENLLHSGKKLTDRQRIQVFYALAHSNYILGIYQLSLSYIFQLLSLDKEPELAYFDCAARLILADIYVRFDNADNAATVLHAAEKDLDKSVVSKSVRDNMLQRLNQQWSTVHAARNEWPEFLKSLHMADSLGDHSESDHDRRLLDYGIYYYKTGDSKLAANYFERLINRKEWSYDRMAAICNYADMLAEEGSNARALEVADLGIGQLEDHVMDQMKADLLKIKAVVLDRTGRSDEAFDILVESYGIHDSIAKWHASHSVLEIARDYELTMDRAERRRIMDSHTGREMLMWCLVGMLVATLCVVGWVWRRNRAQHRLIGQLENDLGCQKSEHNDIMSSTMADLSRKQRNLVALTLKMARLNDLLNKAIDDTDTAPADKRLSELRAGVREVGVNRNVWEIFDILFEQTNPDFFNRLRQLHPDLTRGETRMCAYLIMNLSTKEIAVVTNRSTRTVETVKYRLNKKLNPDGEISLVEYLHRLENLDES